MKSVREAVVRDVGSRRDAYDWSALVGKDASFWRLAATVFALLAVLKGWHVPSLWAATQANLDYSQGFIKRGLFGQVFHSLGIHIAHYDVFVLVSGALLLAAIGLLARWVARSGIWRLGDGVLVAVFAASFTVTYLVHLVGYLEIPMTLLALLAILFNASGRRSSIVLLMGVLGALIHESYIVTFLPMTLLPGFLSAMEVRGSSIRRFMPTVVVTVAIGGIVLVAALSAPMTTARVAGLQAAMSAQADFPLRGDFFPVLSRSAAENLLIMLQTMSHGAWWLAQSNAFITFMPTTAFFLWVAITIINVRCEAPLRWIAKSAVVLSALSPLSLQLVGWDIYRWYALAACSSFVVMTIVCHHYGIEGISLSTAVRNVAIVLIGINLATGTGLFDAQPVNTFPFVDLWRELIRWIGANGHFIEPRA